MKTTFMQSKETVNRNWYVIDAKDIPLGRVASKAATILRGKHKVTYTPHVDCGDYVIIVNADKVALTGNKLEGKIYYEHKYVKKNAETKNHPFASAFFCRSSCSPLSASPGSCCPMSRGGDCPACVSPFWKAFRRG